MAKFGAQRVWVARVNTLGPRRQWKIKKNAMVTFPSEGFPEIIGWCWPAVDADVGAAIDDVQVITASRCSTAIGVCITDGNSIGTAGRRVNPIELEGIPSAVSDVTNVGSTVCVRIRRYYRGPGQSILRRRCCILCALPIVAIDRSNIEAINFHCSAGACAGRNLERNATNTCREKEVWGAIAQFLLAFACT